MSTLLIMLALTSSDCAGCHPQQAALVQASRHAEAAELAVFAVSASHASNKQWCAGCHRPAARGLDCLSCHPDSTHRTPAAVACAQCHEFNTPLPDHLESAVVYSDQPLQSTASELAAVDVAARCVDCHDPHRPTGSHDLAMLRRAVAVTARLDDDATILRITVGHTGHRFPTGDPFRRLVISVFDENGEVVGKHTVGRSFALVDGVWAPVRDHTLAAGESRELRLPRGARWTAVFRYGDPRFESRLPEDEVSVGVAGGRLSVRPD